MNNVMEAYNWQLAQMWLGMGLRLPWTTTDEKTWKIANRLLGYITFPLVFIMLILYFITEQSEWVLFIGFVIWVGIPTIYSFIKQKKTN